MSHILPQVRIHHRYSYQSLAFAMENKSVRQYLLSCNVHVFLFILLLPINMLQELLKPVTKTIGNCFLALIIRILQRRKKKRQNVAFLRANLKQ